jgi:hypothetical protein
VRLVLPKGGKLVIVGLFGGGSPCALPLIAIKAATGLRAADVPPSLQASSRTERWR